MTTTVTSSIFFSLMVVSQLLRQRAFQAHAFCSLNCRQQKFPSTNKQFIRLLASATGTQYTDEALGEARRKLEEAVKLYEANVKATPPNVDLILRELETEASEPDFWETSNQARNSHVTSQISRYSRIVARLKEWESLKGDGEVAVDMLLSEDADDFFSIEEKESLLEELKVASEKLLEDGKRYELELLLSGPYDDQPCRILLTAGAGGTEANDWVADLRRMYERHASKMGFAVTLEDEQAGEVVGYKSVELIVDGGANPYGWFKGEKGAHRLVRLSPFNANNKRQTTFAGVDVAPIFVDEATFDDIDIPDSELEITTMRSGGAGGQNVNKVNSAVRIKHLPTGLAVKCTQERSQAMNKDIAMKRLKAQLLAIAKEQRVAEIKEIHGDRVEAAWGQQIRNYVLHPYKMIKDQRTGWETSNVQNFLDGDLESCIAELLRHNAQEEQDASLQEPSTAQ
ncbi:unnamed protein product [Cylindrotheca closterium]|uniref:Prokaryotic-type class I peptide chain release factors domain-containing protein n=1 Tax=Cylindrotheca closterium TaxID=2856 RepID=A0AAD2FYN6_9STRA|nr:unnamed protein product [Cylindrotheca closterium]